MTDQQEEPEGAQIVATGSVNGNKFEIRIARGDAVITLTFDGLEELDEWGCGSVDYLIAGLPEAAERVMLALEAERDKAAASE